MKNLIFYSLITLLTTFLVGAQNIVTVDNKSNSSADYTDLQAALDEATEGDIIMVAGSPTHYGVINVSTRVALYGPGYNLGENEEPFTQANALAASLSQVHFGAGSEGSFISGFRMGVITVVDDVVVKRNWINHNIATLGQTSNVQFLQNHIVAGGNNHLANGTMENFLFENNIITRIGLLATASNISITYRNNTFFNSQNFYAVHNATMQNNIFISESVNFGFQNVNGIFTNNIVAGHDNAFDSIPGNLAGVSREELLLGFTLPENADISEGEFFQVVTDSPAMTYGTDGSQVGAFGGANPYVLSGIPDIPNIYHLTVPANASASDGLNISIRAKSNN